MKIFVYTLLCTSGIIITFILIAFGQIVREKQICQNTVQAALAYERTEDTLFEIASTCSKDRGCDQTDIQAITDKVMELRASFNDLAKKCKCIIFIIS